MKTPEPYRQSSGIITVELPDVDARAVCQELLEEAQILIAPIEGGPGRIRISTHVFNTDEEAQRLVDALRNYVREETG